VIVISIHTHIIVSATHGSIGNLLSYEYLLLLTQSLLRLFSDFIAMQFVFKVSLLFRCWLESVMKFPSNLFRNNIFEMIDIFVGSHMTASSGV